MVKFKYLLWAFCLLISLQSCCQKLKSEIHQHTIDTNLKHLRLLTYGVPLDMNRIYAENTISEKWGIEIKSVAGCMVDEILIDSVKENNEIVGREIVKKFGSNWWQKFNNEVNIEKTRQKPLIELINYNNYVKSKLLDLGRFGFMYSFHQSNNLDYKIDVYNKYLINELEGKYVKTTYFQFKYNVNDKKLILINDKERKEF